MEKVFLAFMIGTIIYVAIDQITEIITGNKRSKEVKILAWTLVLVCILGIIIYGLIDMVKYVAINEIEIINWFNQYGEIIFSILIFLPLIYIYIYSFLHFKEKEKETDEIRYKLLELYDKELRKFAAENQKKE